MTRGWNWWTGVAASARPPAGPGRARRLAQDAAEAAELRAYQTHPDVVALRVERVRAQVDRLCWTGIVLGLAFTMTNIRGFAAAGALPWSLPWVAAWVLDPTVSLVLLAILRGEQVTARYQVHTGPWVLASALAVDEVQLIMERVRGNGGHAGRVSMWVVDEDPYASPPLRTPLLAVAVERVAAGTVRPGRTGSQNRFAVGVDVVAGRSDSTAE